MEAICYFCSKPSSDWCQNFTAIKSQHTQTPIIEFIRQFLSDFHSARNVYDESNCICAECLQQIDDYDWMRQQVSEQETKLRDLLLATEINLCVKSELVEIKEEIADCHNDDEALDSNAVSQNDNEDMISTTAIIPTHPIAITPPVLKYPIPTVSHRCLIAMAFKNSRSGSLLTSEILAFACEHFPYFKTAAEDWRGAIQSILSLKNSFLKTVPRTNTTNYKNLWTLNPSNIAILDEEIQKCLTDRESNVLSAMAMPENLPALMRGEMKHGRIHCGESVPSNRNNDASHTGVFEEVVIDSPTSLGQVDSNSHDFQPARKRVRQSIDSHVAPTSTYRITSSTASNAQSKMGSKYSRPTYTYACLIAMALKNSCSGSLPLSDICSFISEHFPYFQTAAGIWKQAIRRSLSVNQNFLKTKNKIAYGVITKKWLWEINPLSLNKINEEIRELSQFVERNMMAVPENLPALLRGEMKHGDVYGTTSSTASNSQSKIGLKYSRPSYTYACLIAMALKNSRSGSLLPSGIFSFISEHFPYFQTATADWKQAIRGSLSSHRNFIKTPYKTVDGKVSNKWLWSIDSLQSSKIDEEIKKYGRIYENNIRRAMAVPEILPALLRGEMKPKHGDRNMHSNESVDLIIKSEQKVHESEHDGDDDDDDEWEIYDVIEIDDSKSFQFELNAEDKQNELQKEDSHSIGKRPLI